MWLAGSDFKDAGMDHLLVLEHIAGDDGGRVRADPKLGERAAVLAARVQRLQEPPAGVGVRVDRAAIF